MEKLKEKKNEWLFVNCNYITWCCWNTNLYAAAVFFLLFSMPNTTSTLFIWEAIRFICLLLFLFWTRLNRPGSYLVRQPVRHYQHFRHDHSSVNSTEQYQQNSFTQAVVLTQCPTYPNVTYRFLSHRKSSIQGLIDKTDILVQERVWVYYFQYTYECFSICAKCAVKDCIDCIKRLAICNICEIKPLFGSKTGWDRNGIKDSQVWLTKRNYFKWQSISFKLGSGWQCKLNMWNDLETS